MTEDHARRVQESAGEYFDGFRAALVSCDRDGLHKAWLGLSRLFSQAVADAVAAGKEADSLAAELATHRPDPSQRPVAPDVQGYGYASTVHFGWACLAKVEWRPYPDKAAGLPPFWVLAGRTACGKKTLYPWEGRRGGWPRLHEACPDCLKAAVDAGLTAKPDAERASIKAAKPKRRAEPMPLFRED